LGSLICIDGLCSALQSMMDVTVNVEGAAGRCGPGNADCGSVNGLYSYDCMIRGVARFKKNEPPISFIERGSGFWMMRVDGQTRDNGFFYRRTADCKSPPTSGWVCNFPKSGLTVPTVQVYDPVSCRTSTGTVRKRSLEAVAGVQESVWKHRRFTDATIVCGQVRLEVHRSTLAAASPVFEAAFGSLMKEGTTAVYEINDVSPSAVEAMLRYIYTGTSSAAADDQPQLLELSVQYELESLCQETAEAMQVDVTASNVRERFVVLKRHADRAPVKASLSRMCKLLQDKSKQELLLALV